MCTYNGQGEKDLHFAIPLYLSHMPPSHPQVTHPLTPPQLQNCAISSSAFKCQLPLSKPNIAKSLPPPPPAPPGHSSLLGTHGAGKPQPREAEQNPHIVKSELAAFLHKCLHVKRGDTEGLGLAVPNLETHKLLHNYVFRRSPTQYLLNASYKHT